MILQKIITIILFNILCAYNIFAQNSKIFKIEPYNINEDTILLSDTNIIDFIEGLFLILKKFLLLAIRIFYMGILFILIIFFMIRLLKTENLF
ncbi:hypothetical protein KA977_05425 [Candidatus Dependentiae bacterium]|nr:hypothetical protein [Candidatus Dependentiae bacterium]